MLSRALARQSLVSRGSTVRLITAAAAVALLAGPLAARAADAPPTPEGPPPAAPAAPAPNTISTAAEQTTPTPKAAAAQTENLAEVVVTGSRIKRRDYESQSPIVTVNADTFEDKSAVAIEQTLDQLPQFHPYANQSALSAAQNPFPSATGTPGAAELDLRGLGPNRTLVLIDGRRAQPIDASLVVDINSIPAAAIDTVETITGGAASTYGADAIAGVVNFKLKKNFQGVQIDGQYGISEEGDDQEPQLNVLLGNNLADGKGNVMLALTYANRTGIQGADRSWVRAGWNDPGTVAAAPGANLSEFTPDPTNEPALGWLPSTSSMYYIDQNGNLFDVNNPLNPAHPYTGPIGGSSGFKINPGGSLGWNNEANDELQIPLERWGAFGSAHFNLSDHLSLFAQLNFTETKTSFVGGESTLGNIWAISIPYNPLYDDPASPTFGQSYATAAGTTFHPVSPELAALLDSRPNPDAPWSYSGAMDYIQGFTELNTSTVYQLTAGLDGDVPGTDWTWEVYGSHGMSNVIAEQPQGYPSLEKLQELFSANMYGQNWSNPQTLAVTGHCTSGLPIFNANGTVNNTPTISADCADWFLLQMNTITQLTQEIGEGDLTGTLVDIPWGAGRLSFAVGADYRQEDLNFNPDSGFNANQDSANVVQNIILPVPVQGSISVNEAYAEFAIPLLKDLPAVKSLEFDPGYRFSDYDTAGGVNTFKLLGNWAVTGWMKFRGGLEVANRAPNIAELFTPAGSSMITGTNGTITPDPCAYFDVTPTWGNVPSNPNRYNVQALCQYLMIRQGNSGQYEVPGASANNYDYTVFGPAPYNAPFPYSIAIIQGNPNLKSETARTVTIGAVLRAPFEDPLVSNLSLSVDWYHILVANAIGVASYNAVYQECLDPTFNSEVGAPAGTYTGAQMAANSPACAYINRETTAADPWGAGRNYQAPYINEGGVKTMGLDVEVDWSVRPSDLHWNIPGSFALNILGTYLQEYAVQTFAALPYVDDTGTSVNDSFRYKLFTTASYTVGPAQVGFRWQHLPSIGPPPGSSDTLGAVAYNEVDLFTRYSVTDNLQLRFGVDNLFNESPPTFGAEPGINDNLGATLQDYDLIGRRYYLGLKAEL